MRADIGEHSRGTEFCIRESCSVQAWSTTASWVVLLCRERSAQPGHRALTEVNRQSSKYVSLADVQYLRLARPDEVSLGSLSTRQDIACVPRGRNVLQGPILMISYATPAYYLRTSTYVIFRRRLGCGKPSPQGLCVRNTGLYGRHSCLPRRAMWSVRRRSRGI